MKLLVFVVDRKNNRWSQIKLHITQHTEPKVNIEITISSIQKILQLQLRAAKLHGSKKNAERVKTIHKICNFFDYIKQIRKLQIIKRNKKKNEKAKETEPWRRQ